MQRLMIVVTVPPEKAQDVLDAMAEAGAGVLGSYTHCAYVVSGEGLFKPNEGADPYSGMKGQVNTMPEVRIESFCNRDQARHVMSAIRAAHPYEEPVIHLIPLLDEADL
jgi:hypothetical protein